jgi:hypothetical protein
LKIHPVTALWWGTIRNIRTAKNRGRGFWLSGNKARLQLDIQGGSELAFFHFMAGKPAGRR